MKVICIKDKDDELFLLSYCCWWYFILEKLFDVRYEIIGYEVMSFFVRIGEFYIISEI